MPRVQRFRTCPPPEYTVPKTANRFGQYMAHLGDDAEACLSGILCSMRLLRWFLRRQVRIAAVLFLPFGIMLIVVGLILFCNDWRFARSALRTTGKITMVESRIDSDREEHFFPHFTFSKPDGTIVEIASDVGTNPSDFEVGEQVPVVYDPGNPKNAKIATTFQIYGFSMVLGIVGTVLIPFGFLAKYLRQRFFPT
jgi:hypothetical protein